MTPTGRQYRPSPELVARLGAWKRGCDRGLSTREIADQLGLTQATLVRSIQRARAHGHPDAINHPNAERWALGAGLSHIVSPTSRLRRLRQRAAQQQEQQRGQGQAITAGT